MECQLRAQCLVLGQCICHSGMWRQLWGRDWGQALKSRAKGCSRLFPWRCILCLEKWVESVFLPKRFFFCSFFMLLVSRMNGFTSFATHPTTYGPCVPIAPSFINQRVTAAGALHLQCAWDWNPGILSMLCPTSYCFNVCAPLYLLPWHPEVLPQ